MLLLQVRANFASAIDKALKGAILPCGMSASGHKRTWRLQFAMSALHSIADIAERDRDVRFVPKADILRCSKRRRYSITSSAATSRACAACAEISGRLATISAPPPKNCS